MNNEFMHVILEKVKFEMIFTEIDITLQRKLTKSSKHQNRPLASCIEAKLKSQTLETIPSSTILRNHDRFNPKDYSAFIKTMGGLVW